jgi:hypothetical protein
MARPGILVQSRGSATARSGYSATGTWFVVGATQRGSLVSSREVRNITEFQRYYGDRITQSLLWDSLETFFKEGGNVARVQRVAGPSLATASVTLNDSAAAPALKVSAVNGGIWGNQLSVAVVPGAANGEFALVVTHAVSGQLERSPSLATVADAINWSNDPERYVQVSLPVGASGLDPAVVAATALTGGLDDYAITDVIRQSGLALFNADLGPGQVSAPGTTTATTRAALIDHASKNNRLALVDVVDTSSAAALLSEAQSLQGSEYGALFGPWVTVPGLIAGTTRVVPPVSVAAGLLARSDATNSPNVAAAGENGKARFAVGLTQGTFTDAQRESLDLAGLNLFRVSQGNVQLYGNRTLNSPRDDTWEELTNQRLRMVIVQEATAIAERYVFTQMDGKGQTIAAFNGDLSGMLLRYHTAGSLFGDTPDQAFYVDTGSAVNTPTTIANGELHAVIGVRMSPTADLVVIEIQKTSVAQAL